MRQILLEANKPRLPVTFRVAGTSLSGQTISDNILANNASGMCCGIEQTSYQTLEIIQVVLADGTHLNTASDSSRSDF